MKEQELEIPSDDGLIGCYAASPSEPGPFPAVILYMDAPGIREELRDFTRRIASQGYFCLLPDMYYRLDNARFDLSLGEDEIERMFTAASSLTLPMVKSDTASLLSFLQSNSDTTGKTGIIGYCMSGRYVVAAAADFPTQIHAVASLYGVGIVTDSEESPHLKANQIEAELYLGFAEIDHYVGDNEIPDLREALDAAKVVHKIEVYPDTEHGFCFPGRGPQYNEEAAERVWGIVFDLFNRTLTEGKS
jgi:carboxymethylenebutenolidase